MILGELDRYQRTTCRNYLNSANNQLDLPSFYDKRLIIETLIINVPKSKGSYLQPESKRAFRNVIFGCYFPNSDRFGINQSFTHGTRAVPKIVLSAMLLLCRGLIARTRLI